ncbi:MAG: hypothetical protein ACLGI6_05380, partial [Gammaproteobacteria bacterium]
MSEQYMLIRRSDADTEAGTAPALPGMVALQPGCEGVRIVLDGATATVRHAPAIDPRQQVAGFAVVSAASKEEAIARAQAWPVPEGASVELEVRLMGCPGGCVEYGLPELTPDTRAYAVILRSDANLEAEVLPPQSMLDGVD